MIRKPDVPRTLLLRARQTAAGRPADAAPRLLTRDMLEARRARRRAVVAARTADQAATGRKKHAR